MRISTAWSFWRLQVQAEVSWAATFWANGKVASPTAAAWAMATATHAAAANRAIHDNKTVGRIVLPKAENQPANPRGILSQRPLSARVSVEALTLSSTFVLWNC